MEEENILRFGELIELSGFEVVDSGSMQILKKLIGNQVKKLGDSREFNKVKLFLDDHKEGFKLRGELHKNDEIKSSEIAHNNLFMGVSQLIEKLE